MMTEIIATTAVGTALGQIKENTLLGMLYKDLAQPSAQIIGKSLGTVLEFCTTPLLLLKFGSDAAKLNFNKHITRYEEKINKIKEENFIEVNPQIGIPIINNLTYTTNDRIAELFTTLLSKASSSETVNTAHPAFIKIIEAISPDEAILIYLLGINTIKYDFYRQIVYKDAKFQRWGTDEIKLDTRPLEKLAFKENFNMYISHLESLNLVQWPVLKDEPIYEGEKQTHLSRKTEIGLTDFGHLFFSACIPEEGI